MWSPDRNRVGPARQIPSRTDRSLLETAEPIDYGEVEALSAGGGLISPDLLVEVLNRKSHGPIPVPGASPNMWEQMFIPPATQAAWGFGAVKQVDPSQVSGTPGLLRVHGATAVMCVCVRCATVSVVAACNSPELVLDCSAGDRRAAPNRRSHGSCAGVHQAPRVENTRILLRRAGAGAGAGHRAPERRRCRLGPRPYHSSVAPKPPSTSTHLRHQHALAALAAAFTPEPATATITATAFTTTPSATTASVATASAAQLRPSTALVGYAARSTLLSSACS
jgi:hypothetical protein